MWKKKCKFHISLHQYTQMYVAIENKKRQPRCECDMKENLNETFFTKLIKEVMTMTIVTSLTLNHSFF